MTNMFKKLANVKKVDKYFPVTRKPNAFTLYANYYSTINNEENGYTFLTALQIGERTSQQFSKNRTQHHMSICTLVTWVNLDH